MSDQPAAEPPQTDPVATPAPPVAARSGLPTSTIVVGAILIAVGLWSAIENGPGATLWQTLRKAAPTLVAVGIGFYTVVIRFAVLYQSIGRFNTFYEMAVAMATLVLGLYLTASRLAHMADQLEQRDLPVAEEQAAEATGAA